MAVILAAMLTVTSVRYAKYKKGQDLAVASLMMADSDFSGRTDDLENNRAELVHDMYRKLGSTSAFGNYYEADKALGKLLDEAGYPCYRGSNYLEYPGFTAFLLGRYSSKMGLCIGAAVLLIALIWQLCHSSSMRKTMEIADGKVICRSGKKIVKQFLLRDVTGVSACGSHGLKILGNNINYKIKLVENRDEIRSFIMNSLSSGAQAARPVQPAAAPQSDADELKKYKELLDSGVITQEEFDAKKKQIPGL